MSIGAALGNAITGLGAAGRTAQVVSSNISNALTPGYGRREVSLSTGLHGGVTVAGVQRMPNPALLSDRRLSDAALGQDSTRADGLARLGDVLGSADSPDGLPAMVSRLSARLIEAASQPSSETRLQGVFDAAQDLARSVGRASDGIQSERLRADGAIAREVEAMNGGLARIDVLNREIATAEAQGRDANGLRDRRQVQIDALSELVPLRELPRKNGAVALMTASGQVLLDSEPVRIGFTATNAVTPTTVLGAPLSGLTVGGRPVDMGSDGGRMSGGRLQALFEVRDRTGPEAQARLDGFARDLVERFEGAGTDAGGAGLFTDNAAAFSGTETGISRRLAINDAVDPGKGGQLWRLRTGLASATPAPQGMAEQLQAFSDAMQTSKAATSPVLGATALSLGGQADALLSRAAGALFRAEETQSFSQARTSELIRQELADGVDTDQEMQTLLLIEQAYGANAKVIETADFMLRRILEI